MDASEGEPRPATDPSQPAPAPRASEEPPAGPASYRPVEYWTALHRQSSLRSVGQSGLPVELNSWLYRIGRRNVLAFLRRHGIGSLEGRRVFEVGAGTGYWMRVWHGLGAAAVDGCDLVEVAVDRLRAAYPGANLRVGDIVDPGTIPQSRDYEFVSVMNVLLHVIDESRFERAAANVAGAVAPGGALFLAEPALALDDVGRPPAPGAGSVARPLRRYRAVLEAAGLELVAVGPSTVVGANPIERNHPRIRRYDRLWGRATLLARRGPRWAWLTGLGLSVIDRVAMRTGAAPSGKLLLFRRPLDRAGSG